MRDPETFQPIRQRRGHHFSKALDQGFVKAGNAVQAGRDAGCYKKAYPTKAAAEAAMATINARVGGRPKQLRHSYRCPHCAQFHNTSQRSRA